MPSEKPWTSSSALPRNWILTKIMPPDCLAWQPGGVFVCGGFDGYGMTRRNVVYLPIYSRFQSTCHIRGMTSKYQDELNLMVISIHMPHTWHDAVPARHIAIISKFQSTCHIRGMTCTRSAKPQPHKLFQSTCHIRGMTLLMPLHMRNGVISIHMPHTWHDHYALVNRHSRGCISIHMPHTWHDAPSTSACSSWNRFQSTCHIRGMTRSVSCARARLSISIHMPHTWHDVIVHFQFRQFVISIHMPHTWHDHGRRRRGGCITAFQSTCHIRGMTRTAFSCALSKQFQSTCHIRGMTQRQYHDTPGQRHFNPHATYVA